MRGSGTSQSAAVTSGVAALLLSADPSLTPDQVKYQLNDTAREIDGTSSRLDGDGAVRARRAINRIDRATNAPTQDHARALGMDDWTGVSSWTGGSWNGATWSGATWSSAEWTEDGWDRNRVESFTSMRSADSTESLADSTENLFESAALALPEYTVTDGEVFAAPSLTD